MTRTFTLIVLFSLSQVCAAASTPVEPGASVSLVNAAQGAAKHGKPKLTGTWLFDVTFPPEAGVPDFKETITFHKGGTVSESNTLLHANSANPFFNFNGSDGQGTWRRHDDDLIAFRFVKLVFDGDSNQHIGYLRVTSVGSIENGLLIQDSENSLTELILGPDIETGVVQPFGGADAVGKKIASAP